MNAGVNKAVFLSYASQDADAARRICDALRAAGVEVWFDQGELRGGDAWDAKIRKQIASCELFVPIISANTQARLEGYFRIEWKLAAQRTHAMAEEKTFLVPVVIDDTRDADASVPAEFKAVQWTRLSGGDRLAAFAGRLRSLLAPEAGQRTREPAAPDIPAIAKQPRQRLFLWWLAGALAAAAGAMAVWLQYPRKAAPRPPPETGIGVPEQPPRPSTDKSIALLPFENRNADKDNAEAPALFAAPR